MEEKYTFREIIFIYLKKYTVIGKQWQDICYDDLRSDLKNEKLFEEFKREDDRLRKCWDRILTMFGLNDYYPKEKKKWGKEILYTAYEVYDICQLFRKYEQDPYWRCFVNNSLPINKRRVSHKDKEEKKIEPYRGELEEKINTLYKKYEKEINNTNKHQITMDKEISKFLRGMDNVSGGYVNEYFAISYKELSVIRSNVYDEILWAAEILEKLCMDKAIGSEDIKKSINIAIERESIEDLGSWSI
jgi:hypothetical protein